MSTLYRVVLRVKMKAIRYSLNTLSVAQKPTRYVTIHYEDRRGVANSLRYRNRPEITVLMCEQKS